MKLSTVYAATSLLSVAYCGLFQTTQQAILQDDDFKVPGNNPLRHCDDPEGDILNLTSVDVSPNPPLPGKKLTVVASGTLSEDIDRGATVDLQVKWGLVPLITEHIDLCNAAEEEDLECPIPKGNLTVSDGFSMPDEVPPGNYTVTVVAMTEDGDRITCLVGEVEFKSDGDE